MNRRATPETDAMCICTHHKSFAATGGVVNPDFARRLEIERDGLRSDLEFRRGLFQLQEQQMDSLREQRDMLVEAIRETIMENLHLADGDDCTLKRLKDSIKFELPNE